MRVDDRIREECKTRNMAAPDDVAELEVAQSVVVPRHRGVAASAVSVVATHCEAFVGEARAHRREDRVVLREAMCRLKSSVVSIFLSLISVAQTYCEREQRGSGTFLRLRSDSVATRSRRS